MAEADPEPQPPASATCPSCGAAAGPAFTIHDVNRRITADPFHYNRCPSCGLVFLTNIPRDLGRYYPADYYATWQTPEQLAANARAEKYKIEIVQRFVKAGRLCEVGPGGGGFVWMAKSAGFDVTAIEMDSAVCEFLTRTIGIRTINSHDVPAALRGLESFDVIALWHVIEHIPDPWPVFRAAAERLNPGGVLLLAAPNPESFQFRVFKARWTHVDAPRHVVLIPLDLLTRRARDAGLEPVLVTTTDPGSLGWNTFGWQYTLGNLWPRPLFKRVMMHLGRLISLAMSPFERREFRGSTYTAVYRKPV